MGEALHKLPAVAEKIGKTSRWLRDYLRAHPIGRLAGRDIVFTDADVRCLIASLPTLSSEPPPQETKAKLWRDNKPLFSHPDGEIYFIQSGSHVKIGTARDVGRRFRQLQIAHPVPLELLLSMPGGGVEETELHARFREYRVRGEWFWLAPEIRAFIEKQTAEKQRVLP